MMTSENSSNTGQAGYLRADSVSSVRQTCLVECMAVLASSHYKLYNTPCHSGQSHCSYGTMCIGLCFMRIFDWSRILLQSTPLDFNVEVWSDDLWQLARCQQSGFGRISRMLNAVRLQMFVYSGVLLPESCSY